jgi:hypothetical protein
MAGGDEARERLRFLTVLHAVERLDKQAVTRATARMEAGSVPPSAVEPRKPIQQRDDFDLNQRCGSCAKNEIQPKVSKFNRPRGAWRP